MKIEIETFNDSMFVNGIALMREIKSRGYDAFVVGGAVRDIVMGDRDVYDIDIATNIPIDEIKSQYRTIEYGGGERHGTVIVRYNGFDYELTQFRADGEYSDGRRPDSVEFVSSFEEDSKRRDFTINAMGLDCDGNIIDYHGGISDLNAGIIRTVGNAKHRFEEDALRIIRAVRFAARFNFKIEHNTLDAMDELEATTMSVSNERIFDEITKMSSYGGIVFSRAMVMLDRVGIYDRLFKGIYFTADEAVAMRDLNSNVLVYNLGIMTHTALKSELTRLKDTLKMDNNTYDALCYVSQNYFVYPKLGDVRYADALSVITNRNFDLLRTIYDAMNQVNDTNIDHIITDMKRLVPLTKYYGSIVSEKIKSMNITGPSFGVVRGRVMELLYDLHYGHSIEPVSEYRIEEMVKHEIACL